MTKSELIESVARKAQLPKKKAEEAVNIIFNTMIDALANETRIEIRGLGSWEIREYKGYKGRNPKTGEEVEVPPKKLPFFKTGKELRERVDSK